MTGISQQDAQAPPHIVLIEDNLSDVYLVRLALEERQIPCTVTNFTTGVDALRAMQSLVPDLILMDLNTPCSDGIEILRAIRKTPALSRVPVAVITSSSAPSDRSRVGLIDGTMYVEKPTQLKEFIQSIGNAVQTLLDNRRRLALSTSTS